LKNLKENIYFLKNDWIEILNKYSLKNLSVKKENIEKIKKEIRNDDFESAFSDLMNLLWIKWSESKYQFSKTAWRIQVLKKKIETINN